MDPVPSIVAGLPVCLQPNKVFLDALADSIGPAANVAPIMPS
jgi:hypothetical protein